MGMDKKLARRAGRWGALLSAVALAGCMGQLGTVAPASAEDAASPAELPAATTVPDNEFNQMIGAGERGCGTCHGDMWGLYESIHPALEGSFDTVQDVQMCLDCHNDGQAGPAAWGKEFGTVIHGIHKSVEAADCWSCHATEYGQNDMQLWDVVKYDLMQGIVKVDAETAVSPDGLQATLEYGQDMTVSQETLFTINDLAGPRDMEYAGVDPELTGDALAAEEQRVWDMWTFTVHGNVENERTWTLDELIAEFPPEDVNLKMACFHNPVGGNVIGAVNAQGIKLSKVLEAAGADMESDYAILEKRIGHEPLLHPR